MLVTPFGCSQNKCFFNKVPKTRSWTMKTIWKAKTSLVFTQARTNLPPKLLLQDGHWLYIVRTHLISTSPVCCWLDLASLKLESNFRNITLFLFCVFLHAVCMLVFASAFCLVCVLTIVSTLQICCLHCCSERAEGEALALIDTGCIYF